MKNQPQTKQAPVLTLRDGAVSVAIWANTNDQGVFYNAQPVRSYKNKDDQWRDTDSFSQADLLKLSQLLVKAYEEISAYREQDRQG